MRVEIRSNTALIEGYVNVVERESRPLYDASGPFVEVVSAGTFDAALKENKNVELKYNHKQRLGDMADGSIQLREDSVGLYAKAKVTDYGIIEKARKGELRGWSFGFVCKEDSWENIDNAAAKRKRNLKKIELREVSILDKTPAYIATSIEMRNNNEALVEFRGVPELVEVIEERQKDAEDNPCYFFAEKELEIAKLKGGILQ